ncbi:TnpV protein, partial [Mediterraneibacter gnavus]|uniref:TnpV protein n=1 Tax=Mediterraneibacter gnavus TaxID=33038 RepID=UPI00156E185B
WNSRSAVAELAFRLSVICTQGITEQLKVENVLEWIGRMNNIQVCAREIVDKEIIYQE